MLELRFDLSWNYQGRKGKETLFHTAIGNFLTAMKDWSPALRSMIEEVLEPSVDERFNSSGLGEWAPLAPNTVKRKGSTEILFTSGRLKSSFTSGSGDNVSDVTRSSLRWGSRLPYSLFHQTGTRSGFQLPQKGPGPGVPMRKILKLTSGQKGEMRSLLTRRLATIARKEGFGVTGNSRLDPLAARNLGNRLLGL